MCACVWMCVCVCVCVYVRVCVYVCVHLSDWVVSSELLSLTWSETVTASVLSVFSNPTQNTQYTS